jgi:hypothetical protein
MLVLEFSMRISMTRASVVCFACLNLCGLALGSCGLQALKRSEEKRREAKRSEEKRSEEKRREEKRREEKIEMKRRKVK